MTFPLARLAALGLLVSSMATPASAQWFGPPPGAYPYNPPPPVGGPPPVGNRFYGYARALPPDVIVERLEDQGYEDVADPRLVGTTYVTVASYRGRGRVRLVVDAFRGVVVEQNPISRRSARAFEDRDEWPGQGGRFAPSPYDERSPAPAYRPEPVRREPARPRANLAPQLPPAGFPPTQDARPDLPRPATEAALPPPADQRLAPGPERPSAPPAPTGNGGVYGTNPDARPSTRPTNPRPAAPREARTNGADAPRIPPVARPTAPAPDVAARPSGPATTPPVATADPVRAEKPVRVIQGVTPLNNNQATPPVPAPN